MQAILPNMRIVVLARLNLLRYPIVSRFTSIRYPDLLPGTAVPNACRGHANVRPVSPKRPFVPSEWLSVFRSGLMVNCLLQRTGCAGSYSNKNNSSLKSQPMKKLFVMTMVLLVAAGCSRDEAVSRTDRTKGSGYSAPFLRNGDARRPLAGNMRCCGQSKVWSRPAAQRSLTVKFLNGSDSYQSFVKEVASEWEKACGVRFHYVNNDRDALIRVGFDRVPGMMSSWAFTGTDHNQLSNRQTEPTVHFAQWRGVPMHRNEAMCCGHSARSSGWNWNIGTLIFLPDGLP